MNENEKNVLKEEHLEDVSGGGFECEGDCYFVADPTITKKLFDGQLYLLCNSSCRPFPIGICSCHGSVRCKDKFHRVEQFEGEMWGPSPKGENNHSAADKRFIMK